MLKIIAAVAENGVIGSSGKLPWKLPDDMTWFKQRTGTSPVVMGRKTYESLPPKFRPLPGRENVVLSRDMHDGRNEWPFTLYHDLKQVLKRGASEDIWVVGGAEIYALALPYAEELYITRVHAFLPGDTFFPEWREGGWNLTFCERKAADDRNQYNFTWQIWKRALPPASK